MDAFLDSNAPPTPTLAQLRRKLAGLKEIARNEANMIDSLNRSIANLTSALRSTKSQIVQTCNRDRKDKASAAVRKDFENNLREMGDTGTKKTLQVFCTSSVTYLNYISANTSTRKAMGFPDLQTTEIPRLRDWLVEITLPKREEKAQGLLESTERLMGSMKPWIDDRSGDMKMTIIQRRGCEPIFEGRVKELEQVCRRISAVTRCLHLILIFGAALRIFPNSHSR